MHRSEKDIDRTFKRLDLSGKGRRGDEINDGVDPRLLRCTDYPRLDAMPCLEYPDLLRR